METTKEVQIALDIFLEADKAVYDFRLKQTGKGVPMNTEDRLAYRKIRVTSMEAYRVLRELGYIYEFKKLKPIKKNRYRTPFLILPDRKT